MAGGKFSEALLAGMTIRESANDGSDFTNPAADYRRLFLGEDGELHTKDSAGSVAGFAGSGISATLADAAGDMLVASAADTWAKLATPTVNGQALQRVSGSPAWALPPGYEFDYAETTSATSVTQTAEASADTVITGNAVTYDGSTIVQVECFLSAARPDNTAAGRQLSIWLYDGSSSIGRLALLQDPAAATMFVPIFAVRRLTPSNASHTYSIRATVNAGTGSAGGGAGGAGNGMPGFIRIIKA